MKGNAARLVKRGSQALRHAVERRRFPDRFILVDQTPWEEIHRDDIMAVRRYRLPPMDQLPVGNEREPVRPDRFRTPLLLVPALGIQTWTFDIMPNRSMVRYLMARGFEVYLVDWGRPSESQYTPTLSTYVNRWMPRAVEAVRQHSGAAQVSLLGYCMGGLLAMFYLATQEQAPVRNLVTLASPVNFHASGRYGALFRLVSGPAELAHRRFRLSLAPLDARLFRIPGRLLSLGFKMTNPPGVVASYLDLVRNIADREYVTEHMTMGQWFNDMVDYPGAVVREIILKMILANQMAGGRIRIGDRIAHLDRIRCPLFVVAGASDRLVTSRAVKDVLRLVGSRDTRFMVAPGGHAGVFAGSQAPVRTWAPVADWLAERSI